MFGLLSLDTRARCRYNGPERLVMKSMRTVLLKKQEQVQEAIWPGHQHQIFTIDLDLRFPVLYWEFGFTIKHSVMVWLGGK